MQPSKPEAIHAVAYYWQETPQYSEKTTIGEHQSGLLSANSWANHHATGRSERHQRGCYTRRQMRGERFVFPSNQQLVLDVKRAK